jgi:hypothetical protein
MKQKCKGNSLMFGGEKQLNKGELHRSVEKENCCFGS